MDTKTFSELLKDDVIEQIQKVDLKSKDWDAWFLKWKDPSTRTQIIWILRDLAEKKEYVDKIVAIADMYSKDPNPDGDFDDLNKKIEAGEDIRSIYTVRGTLPWLLQTLIATFKTEYYPDILKITERLIEDQVYYVRQQATVPLSLFVANLRAKKNVDGTDFNFTDKDKSSAYSLSFKMLRENCNLPRVLEYVSNVFDKLRNITAEEAKEVLTTFCYNEKKINPEYLTSHVVPLVIFFAEFRKKNEAGFDNYWFQVFLENFIKDAKDSCLRSTLIWHMWRVIEEDASNYQLVKKYIPLLFENISDHEPVGQMEFLVNEVLKADSKDGIELYITFLNYLDKMNFSSSFKLWLTQTEETLERIKKIDSSKVLEILPLLKGLRLKGCYVGDEKTIFPEESADK